MEKVIMNMTLSELILVVKMIKDISYLCNEHGDCTTCIFRDVVCPKSDRCKNDYPYIPEEWDYNLLIDRIAEKEKEIKI